MADVYEGTWISAYEAIATELLKYENRQGELCAIVERVIHEHFDVMDPLTFFAMFNGKLRNESRRKEAVKQVIEGLKLDVEPAQDFWGIPILNPMRWRYWDGKPGTIEHNWEFFRAAIAFADNPSDESRAEFIRLFDIVRAQGNTGDANVTMALFWIRPNSYLPLDNNTQTYLRNRYDITVQPPTWGEGYLSLLDQVRSVTEQAFVNISFAAWELGGWIPAPSEYDPGITADKWRELLKDPSVCTENQLVALKCLAERPGGATGTELADEFGRGQAYYTNNIATLGEKVVERLGIEVRQVTNGKYWPVLCVGGYVKQKKRKGVFEWKLRKEVSDALASIDLSDIPTYENQTDSPWFDRVRLRRLIALYKQDYDTFRHRDHPEEDQESYKWDRLATYKENWDIEAEDFAGHVSAALKSAAQGDGQLLGSSYEYPYPRLVSFLEFDQEGVREAFRNLYEPDQDRETAYVQFTSALESILSRYNESADRPLNDTGHNPKAVSLYLFFEHPEREHYFKPSVGTSLAEALGTKLPGGQVEKWLFYERLCDEIMPEIVADEELVALNDSALNERQRSADPAHHLLLQDIGYYCDRYMKDLHPNWEQLLDGSEAPEDEEVPPMPAKIYPKNIILYGPPGTGKTYQTRAYAVAICEGKRVEDILGEMKTPEGRAAVSERYKQLAEDGRVGFTTFHQSFGYEEFIEGLRPVFDEQGGVMKYPPKPGIFRKFCEAAEDVVGSAAAAGVIPRFRPNPNPRVWKMGLSATEIPNLLNDCRKEGCIRMGWDEVAPEDVEGSPILSPMNKRAIRLFQDEMQPGDFVVVPGVSSDKYGVAVVTGDFDWKTEFKDACRYRTCAWLPDIDKAKILELNDGKALTLQTCYELNRISAAQLVEAMGLVSEPKRRRQQNKPFVFIIDEINRGNVSKVFGELITTLEESKRKGAEEELLVDLPYSGKKFGVPQNVYVIGTMNTADRSIALMDTALRRRFSFVEVMPEPELFDKLEVEGVNVGQMLRTMNKRIEVLYDREHTLGHAYFMPLKSTPTIACLQSIFQNKVIPLLQEYFFDDYGKIRAVLGWSADRFVRRLDTTGLFAYGDDALTDYDQLESYQVLKAPEDSEAYQLIYEAPKAAVEA